MKIMFKRLILCVIWMSVTLTTQAQSLNVTPVYSNGTIYHIMTPGRLKPFIFQWRSRTLVFTATHESVAPLSSVRFSPDALKIGVYTGRELRLYAYPGRLITTSTYAVGGEVAMEDPSLALIPLNDGRVIVRSNISQFSFYDLKDSLLSTVSNAMGTRGGEEISDVAVGQGGAWVYLINPKIIRNGHIEARVRRWIPEQDKVESIWYGSGRIVWYRLLDRGAMIALHLDTAAGSRFMVLDAYGHVFFQKSFEKKMTGGTFSDDGRWFTVWTANTIQVYDLLHGKRVLYTMVQGPPVHAARYFPEDQVLLGVGWEADGRRIGKVRVFAVDRRRRRLVSQKVIATERGLPGYRPVRIQRIYKRVYLVRGLSNSLRCLLGP